jgi:hypothetical protein
VVKTDANAAQGRLDSLGVPPTQYSYNAIRNTYDYADMASHEARGAAQATGDNDEVRAVHVSNMKQHLDSIDGQMHGTS